MSHLCDGFNKKPVFVFVTVGLGVVGLYAAGPLEAVEPNQAATACEALQEVDVTGVEDAPTQVIHVQAIRRKEGVTGNVPAHCRVEGYVSPNVGIVLQLPVKAEWNGNFIEMSLGGYGGSTKARAPWCEDALRRGYVCLTHDTGHTGWSSKASWAYNNLQAEFDYGIRGFYVAALAGKALTEHFYGTPPKYSYHVGSSGGGKQGLVAAQRYPWTFNGILAFEPSNVTATGVVILWNAVVTHDKNGDRLFTDEDLDVLNQGAIASCDADDGLEDGIIGDPRTCDFDPRELLCESDNSSKCLTPVQVDAARKVYEGPVTSDGEKLSKYFPWYPSLPGTERGGYFNKDLDYKTQYWQFMGFNPDPGPSWTWSDFDFDHDYKRTGMMDAVVNGYSNPDLRNFKAAGGKVMVIQGWGDSGLPGPLVSVDYYEMVERIIGDRPATHDFYRLFMIPGRSHFDDRLYGPSRYGGGVGRYGGDGAAAGDWLSYLESWVEKDEAPDVIVGYHAEDWSEDAGELYRGLKNPERYKFSRPHYPYPLQARYSGSGDPDDHRSFEPVDPERR